MVDVRGDVLWSPHDTTPAAVKANKNQKWESSPQNIPRVYHAAIDRFVSIDWLFSTFIDWLDWFVNTLIEWFVNTLTDWFVNILIDSSIDQSIDRFVNTLFDWSNVIDRSINWLIDWLFDWYFNRCLFISLSIWSHRLTMSEQSWIKCVKHSICEQIVFYKILEGWYGSNYVWQVED